MTELQKVAVEQLNEQHKKAKYGQKAKVMARPTLDALISFCEQSETFAEAVHDCSKTFQDCMANAEIAAGALLEMCQGLKQMRDTKLYLQLNMPTFDAYCEDKVGIKARQAYTYISTYEKLGSTVLQSNANLGITKLELIAQLPAPDRAADPAKAKVLIYFEALKKDYNEMITAITELSAEDDKEKFTTAVYKMLQLLADNIR